MMMPNATAGVISMRFGWTGPALCIATACAAGTNAIGEGVRLIRDGSADVVIAGGTEFPVTPITLAAFAAHGRAEHTQRRPLACFASVRRRPRRVRDRRGCRVLRARVARTRTQPRRAHLRRGRRLRPQLRRVPHHCAVTGWRRRSRVHAAGPRRRGADARRHRPRQRARHVDRSERRWPRRKRSARCSATLLPRSPPTRACSVT